MPEKNNGVTCVRVVFGSGTRCNAALAILLRATPLTFPNRYVVGLIQSTRGGCAEVDPRFLHTYNVGEVRMAVPPGNLQISLFLSLGALEGASVFARVRCKHERLGRETFIILGLEEYARLVRKNTDIQYAQQLFLCVNTREQQFRFSIYLAIFLPARHSPRRDHSLSGGFLRSRSRRTILDCADFLGGPPSL